MPNFFPISFTILLILGSVKADCLPGAFALNESGKICLSKIPEGDKNYMLKKGADEPESIRCFSKCMLEGAHYFKNGTFTLEKLFKHIDETFTDKSLGEYMKMKKQSHVEEASKLDNDCDKAKKYVELAFETMLKEPKFNVPYCKEA